MYDVKLNNLYKFVENSFEDRAVPKSIDIFKNLLNTQTTDGSLCLTYQFGNIEKDEITMVFFYNNGVAIPSKYRGHLKEKYKAVGGIRMLGLDYLVMCACSATNTKYLNELLDQLKEQVVVEQFKIDSEIQMNKDLLKKEDAKIKNDELRTHLSEYIKAVQSVSKIIQDRIDELNSQRI